MAMMEDARLAKRPRSDGIEGHSLEPAWSDGDRAEWPCSDARRGDCAERRLYLIFDDWLWGYSIRKVALLFNDEARPDGAIDIPTYSTERPPPQAIFRLPAPRGSPLCFAPAFNSIIMAMHPPWGPEDERHPLVMKKTVPAFDVYQLSVIFGPRCNAALSNPIYISVNNNNRLLALSSRSFELLEQKPLTEPDSCSPLAWRKLPVPPFDSEFVTSHAVHSDGRTVFFTVFDNTTHTGSITTNIRISTFSFHMGEDMGEGSFRWEEHGPWMLPFIGRAYFDPELDAWIGLARYPKIGHLCACDVVSTRTEAHDVVSARKISKEKLFSENLDENHVGATLVYLGRSRFCLVQCIKKYDKNTQPQEGRFPYRVTTFSLKYDKNGNLTTGKSRLIQYYSVPESTTELLLEHPVAFWM